MLPITPPPKEDAPTEVDAAIGMILPRAISVIPDLEFALPKGGERAVS